MMTSKQWEEVKGLFLLALERSADRRLAFLDSACKDESIRAEVRELLELHDEAGDFLAEPAWGKLSTFGLQSYTAAFEFSGTPRFVVQERLGEGTFGIVYRVLDRQRNSMVALKALRRLDAAHLSRFKNEFRSLVDIVHPNLVQLYELFGDDNYWFFTMELVDGADFLSYTRPNDILHSWDRLRDALVQLTSGVQALHCSARLHRDLKPSNVMVSKTGQVLILDFGLVKYLERESAEQSTALAGSPAYMAPEQVGRGTITAAVDWYAVGVMLYRAITGTLPFQGDWQEVLNRKQTEDPPNPKVLNSEVPEDLNEICSGLLQRAPGLRADGSFVLERLQCPSAPLILDSQDHFVGRSRELELLRQRFCSLDSGIRQVVLLQGRSGIGKTTLVDEFLDGVPLDRHDTVILRGRCHESESVPYKALDSVVDQLVRYLRSLPAASAAALLPRHPALLTRMFPVFGGLEILSTFPDRIVDQADEQQIRLRAFGAICETLGRLTDRHPIVISIDDMQWADLDSIAFLSELVVPVHAPALMLILIFRSEDADRSSPLLLLRTLRASLTNTECWTEIELAGLPEEDGRDLLRRLDKDQGLAEEQLRRMTEESRGSPLFLRELLRVTLQDAEKNAQGGSAACVTVTEMIKRRADTLSPVARQLLEALSVAVDPLAMTTLFSIMEAPDAELSREIRLLLHESLVRVTGGLEARRLEPFHDQVREASLTSLSPSSLQNWHQRLARAFEAEETLDPQKLVRHYLGAGEMSKAFRSASTAAESAKKALAFDRAAGFYKEAIETGEATVKDLAMLHYQRAEALAKAGRGRESAKDYLCAAQWPEHNDVFEMRRLAAEQLMRCGYLDEGVEAFKELLRSAGFWMPATPLQSIVAMLAIRAISRLRGLRWRRRHEAELPARTLRNLDLLWSGALVFSVVNPVFGTYLQARHMLEALGAGEPFRLALSVGQGAHYEALGGVPHFQDGCRFLEFAEQIASDLQNSYLSCAITVNRVFVDLLCGRIQDGLEHSRRAVQILRELGLEQTWESSTAKLGLLWFLGWGGRIREMSGLVPGILDEARSRGDVYTFVVIRCCALSHRVDLAADDPDGALEQTRQALGQWSQVRYDIPHLGAAFSAVECELYAGRINQARNRSLAEWGALKNSLLARKCQTFRIMLYYMRARTALAMWLQRRDDRALVGEIEHYVSQLKNSRAPWGAALGEALQSSVDAGHGRVPEAILLLDRAEAALRQLDFRLFAAAVSRRRGELEGEAGSARVQAADAFMRSENIVRPDRMTFMILPG
jgi:eukaryotic-like serine/threonine-protein kinase